MEVPGMETVKPDDSISSEAPADLNSSNQTNTRPASLESDEKMELEVLLEELAEIIESEDGLLIP
jgi:hypothetical protein